MENIYRAHPQKHPSKNKFITRYLSNLVVAFLAGIIISVSAVVYLSISNKYLGSLLLSVGFIVLLSYGLLFFTNKTGYILGEGLKQKVQLVVIWFGNILGTVITGYILRLTRISYKISVRAGVLTKDMLSDGIISNLLLGLFCGILMFVAADSFKNAKNIFEKYLLVIASVMAFVLCGFEHCILNTFFLSTSNTWSIKAIFYILVITLGNILGSVVIPFSHKIVELIKAKA